MVKQALLYRCHYQDASLSAVFDSIRRDVDGVADIFLSYDNSRGDLLPEADVPYHIFTVEGLHQLGYYCQSESERTLEGLIAPLPWIHAEYPILDFYRQHPEYDFVWAVDYDVRFTGSWALPIRHYADRAFDFIASWHERFVDTRTWTNWKRLNNFEIPLEERIKAFFPILRFSKRALQYLHERYSTGTWGYCEVIVPTLLQANKYHLHDLTEEGRFGTIETIRWRPFFEQAGETENCFYHPVDPIRLRDEAGAR